MFYDQWSCGLENNRRKCSTPPTGSLTNNQELIDDIVAARTSYNRTDDSCWSDRDCDDHNGNRMFKLLRGHSGGHRSHWTSTWRQHGQFVHQNTIAMTRSTSPRRQDDDRRNVNSTTKTSSYKSSTAVAVKFENVDQHQIVNWVGTTSPRQR